MANFTAIIPSGSTNGRPIKVVATATAGTTVHTATNSGADVDEVWIWANAINAAGANLSIIHGTQTDMEQQTNHRIPGGFGGSVCVMAGRRFSGGIVLTATASTANVINLEVNINRISNQSS